MAQIEVTGLAEVLSDHENRIAAAQAWCVQQNIRSIDELKSRGDAAEDAFIVAAFSSHRVGPVDAAGRRGVLDVEWLLVCDGMFNVMSSQPEPRDCFGQGATLGEMDPVEPRRDLRWSHDDENYSILEKWCGDVIYREKDVDDLPLHRLRRTVIDAERWLNPGIFRDCPDYLPYYVYDPRLGCLLVALREQ